MAAEVASSRQGPVRMGAFAGVVALIALASVTGARTAVAQPADNKARAEAKVTEARQNYERGDYQEALQNLDEAVALFPSPKLHFNFGAVYTSLGRNVEAIEAFQRFLALASDIDPARRDEAERRIKELQGRVGSFEIESDTRGASVFVDGRAWGTTPLARAILVAPGYHQVVVQKDGIPVPYTDRMEVRAGQTVKLRATLAPLASVLASRPALMSITEPPPPVSKTFYKQWWFWTGMAVVGGAVAGILITANREDKFPCADCATTLKAP